MFIYMITEKTSGKVYIGLDGSNVHHTRRWKYHLANYNSGNKALYQAMRDLGIENFEFSILEVCETDNRENLKDMEKKWIRHFHSTDPKFGFNKTAGGQSHSFNYMSKEEQEKYREKSSESNKLRWDNLSSDDRDSFVQKIRDSHTQKRKQESSKILSEIWSSMSDDERHHRSRGIRKYYEVIDRAELKKKNSLASSKAVLKNAKQYIVTNPLGYTQEIVNLRAFCRENGLTSTGMLATAKGIYSNHKGWRCREIVNGIAREPEPSFKRKNTTWWLLRSPDGELIETTVLKDMASEKHFNYGKMIMNGRSKGWSVVEKK